MVKDHLRYMNEVLDMNEMLEMNHRWEGEGVILEYWGNPCYHKLALPSMHCSGNFHKLWSVKFLGEFRERVSPPKGILKFVEGIWVT